MSESEQAFDVAIVGGGIVGAAIAYFASPALRVQLLEAEDQPGYHATGRSAALFTEAYGPPMVRALTRASRSFFDDPPRGLARVPLLRSRGALFVGGEAQRPIALDLHRRLLADGLRADWLEGEAVREKVPVLRPGASACGVLDPNAFDVDVDALLQGFLRGARANGASVALNARVDGLAREGTAWALRAGKDLRCRARVVVNAAGAWADEIGRLAGAKPIRLEPRRRSAFLFSPPAGVAVDAWPAVIASDESWYFKPDAGLLLGSPANADPVPPHDVVAEEFDVALGIHRIEEATTMTIQRPRSTWAGLRSFVADGEPVCGFDVSVPGLFWAAALGGYGIQTAPAFGRLCTAMLRREALPEDLAAHGLVVDRLAPARL